MASEARHTASGEAVAAWIHSGTKQKNTVPRLAPRSPASGSAAEGRLDTPSLPRIAATMPAKPVMAIPTSAIVWSVSI